MIMARSDKHFSDIPFLKAAADGDLATVKKLVEKGQDTTQCDMFGQNAVHCSAMGGRVEILKYLETKGLSLLSTDDAGTTAAHYAAQFGHTDILRFLGEYAKPTLTSADNDGDLPIHSAAKSSNTEALMFLSMSGHGSLDSRNNSGDTPAHLAAQYGHTSNLRFIKEHAKATLTSANNEGDLPLHKAADLGNQKALMFLLRSGYESLNTRNNNGLTPLDMLKGDSIKILKADKADCLKAIKKEFPDIVDKIDSDVKLTEPAINTTDGSSDSEPQAKAESTLTKETNEVSEDQRVAEMLQANIANQGDMYIRNVKGMLIGPPGVGKTVTINRLTGKMKNISQDGGMASTGIDKPVTFNLYHNTEKQSIVIHEDWSPQSLDQQLGTLVYCMTTDSVPSHSGVENRSSDELKKATDEQPLKSFPLEQKKASIASSSSPDQPKSMHQRLDTLFELIKGLIVKSEWEKVQQILENVKHTTLFHVIDTGGQPEFYDILPLLIHGPCFALVFINLIHPLNQPFSVTYRHTPDVYSQIQYESVYNQLQMIHMTLAAMHSLNSGKKVNERSAAFILATHLDKATGINLQEVMQEIDDLLKDSLFYKKDVLLKCLHPESKVYQFFYALNNYSGDDKEIAILRGMLTHLIKTNFKPERLPTSWGIYHLLLRHKYEEHGLCTLQESIQLGLACGIKDESEVKITLKYFHTRFGTILYYEAVDSLKWLIICDPNLVFRPITKLIAESFGANPSRIETAKVIRISGEISYDFLEEICSEDEVLQRIPTMAIVDLLKHHNIITECVVNGERKLFMSCLLKPCPSKELPMKYTPDQGREVEPLLFTFKPHGYQPVSLFHVLASKLLASDKFVLIEPRYKDKLGFTFGTAEVEIYSHLSHLEIRIIRINQRDQQRCTRLKDILQKNLNSILSTTPHMAGTKAEISFYCPNSSGESPHIASLHVIELDERINDEPFAILNCTGCKKMCMKLKPNQEIWFADEELVSGGSTCDLSSTDKVEMKKDFDVNTQLIEQLRQKVDGTNIKLMKELEDFKQLNEELRKELRILSSDVKNDSGLDSDNNQVVHSELSKAGTIFDQLAYKETFKKTEAVLLQQGEEGQKLVDTELMTQLRHKDEMNNRLLTELHQLKQINKGLHQEIEMLRSKITEGKFHVAHNEDSSENDSKGKTGEQLQNETDDLNEHAEQQLQQEDPGIEASTVYGELSATLSSESPIVDWTGYGLKLELDHSSSVSKCEVHIKSLSSENFMFPNGSKPISGVYSISLSDSFAAWPIKMRMEHFVELSDPEQLECLSFAKTSQNSPHQFELVKGGVFKVGGNYGEIKENNLSDWTIVGWLPSIFGEKIYRGLTVYVLTQPPHTWMMQIVVAKNQPEIVMALRKFVRLENQSASILQPEPEFKFKFTHMNCLLLKDFQNFKRPIEHNGWKIVADIAQISKSSADDFKTLNDLPGRCILKIYPHSDSTQPASRVDYVTRIDGINSDKKTIMINPPLVDQDNQTTGNPLTNASLISHERLAASEVNNKKSYYSWFIIFLLVTCFTGIFLQFISISFKPSLNQVQKHQLNDISDSDESELLTILSNIPVNDELETFCRYLGLDSAGCSELASKGASYDIQRNRLIRLWRNRKKRTWSDFIIALDKSKYCTQAMSLAEQKKCTHVIKYCLNF